ncbi:MAG TPA: hypothetical protein VGQ99_19985 [Tepidisphaeraceae bacterium]|jgi:hypothetical protein|nr:hypothetical protein [Tepidisphaeraceae bacterium]
MLPLRICLILLILTSISHADHFRLLDDDHPLLPDVPATSPTAQPFDKNTWSLDLAGSYIIHIRWSEDYLTTGSARLNYYIWKNVAFTFGLSGYLIDQPDNDATAGSFDIGGRIHLLRIDRFTLYFDGGGSRIFSNTAVPEFGTTYNYIGRVGGGATWHLFNNVHLMAGARYFHLSNGDVHGRINNPSFDGIESYAGLIFTF